MRLIAARIQKYRSIRDSGWFDVETEKTILVGPNEAGKSVILRALQQLSPPDGIAGFDPLRDFPRSEFGDVKTGKVDPKLVTVVEGEFVLEQADKDAIPEEFRECVYVRERRLDNSARHSLKGAPENPRYIGLKASLTRLCAHIDTKAPRAPEGSAPLQLPSEELASITGKWADTQVIEGDVAVALNKWLTKVLPLVDENNDKEVQRHAELEGAVGFAARKNAALTELNKRLPVFVLFNNYFRVRPLIHLDHLAKRLADGTLDENQFDYGNLCLLKLLGFTARELSDLGQATPPPINNQDALKAYKDQLDTRSYQLNAASVSLTKEICSVWLPDSSRGEADQLRIVADGQYLKVVVVDDLGVEIELDQRSEVRGVPVAGIILRCLLR